MVRLDPNLLDAQKIATIENELNLLPSQKIEDVIIDDDIYGLLRYVFRREPEQLHRLHKEDHFQVPDLLRDGSEEG